MQKKSEKLKKLQETVKDCKNCELHKSRTNVVFSGGNAETAKIILIGEAPGEKEDLSGKPFVGDAGKNLDKCLEKAGLEREKDLYIINTLKCRPTKKGLKIENRTPKASEKKACIHFLLEQIQIIDPKIIILCGNNSVKLFLGNDKKVTEIHGEIFEIKIGKKFYKAMPILHPSPLCFNRIKPMGTAEKWTIQDLKKAKKFI